MYIYLLRDLRPGERRRGERDLRRRGERDLRRRGERDLRRRGEYDLLDTPLHLCPFGQLFLLPPLDHKFLHAQYRADSLSFAEEHLCRALKLLRASVL